MIPVLSGGRGGIRTHGTLAGTPVFKTGALNRSATLPDFESTRLVGAYQDKRRIQPPLRCRFATQRLRSCLRPLAVSRQPSRWALTHDAALCAASWTSLDFRSMPFRSGGAFRELLDRVPSPACL